MPYQPPEQGQTPKTKVQGGRAAAIAAIFCGLSALFVLLANLPMGGIPPEFPVFLILMVIFSALWWSGRK